MQYQVPQFIEVEDKIFGPLTFKQFLYVAGGAGAALIFFTLFPKWLAAIFSLPFVALGLALAFYRVNERPFIHFLENAFSFYTGSRLYLWQQRQAKPQAPQAAGAEGKSATMPVLPKVSESKLKDLAWSLNIKDRQKLGVANDKPSGFEI